MNNLRQQLEASKKATEALLSLSEKFPDLTEHRNRWGQVRYASKTANAMVTDYESTHGCGCCDDAVIQIWPFVEIDGTRVYSDPTDFVVGNRRDFYGADLNPGWQAKMRREGIPEELIARIAEYLDGRENYRDEEGEEETFTPAEPEESPNE